MSHLIDEEVCGNNINEVSFVTNLQVLHVINAETELLALFHRRGRNKQVAKEKQLYVFILYLNPGKHTIAIKQQTTFLESS